MLSRDFRFKPLGGHCGLFSGPLKLILALLHIIAHYMRGLLGFWGQGGHLYGAVDVNLV